jgi:hypothetical protein
MTSLDSESESEADLRPITLDTLSYKQSGSTAVVNPSGSVRCSFPRNLVCVCGVLFSVEEASRNPDKPGPLGLGFLERLCIPHSVKKLSRYCLSGFRLLSVVTFESGSRLSAIVHCACFDCPSISSIFIPSAVVGLPRSCFFTCHALSRATFEAGGRLSFLGDDAFCECYPLSSTFIFASVKTVGESCFSGCRSLSIVVFESNSRL